MWKKWFGKKDDEPSVDPLHDLKLSNLQMGYLVDHDLKTWEVKARHSYDFGGGDRTIEWELWSGEERLYLSYDDEDEGCWTLTRKITINAIDPGLKSHIMKNEDPPDTLQFEGVTYHLDSSGGGNFLRGGQNPPPPPQPFLFCDFESEDGEGVLTIEQWGDDDFEASVGTYVEEYQFTNILPKSG
jgi:hypothetical protein